MTPREQALIYRIQGMLRQGYSYRDIASRSGLSRGEVFGLAHAQHATRSATAERALENLNRDFTINILTASGEEWVEPARLDAYSLNGEYWAAMRPVVESNFTDFSSLRPFRGKSIDVIGRNGREKIRLLDDRDAATIRRLAELGELDPVDVTRGGSGRRRVR